MYIECKRVIERERESERTSERERVKTIRYYGKLSHTGVVGEPLGASEWFFQSSEYSQLSLVSLDQDSFLNRNLLPRLIAVIVNTGPVYPYVEVYIYIHIYMYTEIFLIEILLSRSTFFLSSFISNERSFAV